MSDLMGRGPLGQKQPKAKKPAKGMRKVSAKKAAYRASPEGKAAMEYVGMVKQLTCCVCGAPAPSDAHHVIHDRYGSRKASDFDTIPLCKAHHQDGPEAIHTNKTAWAEKHGPDYGFVKQTRELISKLLD